MARWNKGMFSTLEKPTKGSKILPWIIDIAIPYEGDDCLIFPFGRMQDGYASVFCGGKIVKAHRLICEQRHGPAPSPSHQAAHSCGNGHGGCVNPNHLSWKTPTENNRERRKFKRLTPAQVAQIRSMPDAKARDLAEQFGVTAPIISKARRGKTWARVKARSNVA